MTLPAIVQSSLFLRFSGLTCGLSTRIGGVSPDPLGMNMSFHVGDAPENVEKNRRRFFQHMGITPEQVALPKQEHTSVVRKVLAAGSFESCDALLTDRPGVFLGISVADCTPIFLFDPAKHVVAAVHAGWRGTEQKIAKRTIDAMKREFETDPGNVVAFIGPAAGVCCYEVGSEVAGKFEARFAQKRDGKIYLDVKADNVAQLLHSGVPSMNIEISPDCTICGTKLYHSFRRDRDRSGRMMGIIGMSN
jgi:YfiH family protein